MPPQTSNPQNIARVLLPIKLHSAATESAINGSRTFIADSEFAKMAKDKSHQFQKPRPDHEARALANRHIATFASCIWPRRNGSCGSDWRFGKQIPPSCERGSDAAASSHRQSGCLGRRRVACSIQGSSSRRRDRGVRYMGGRGVIRLKYVHAFRDRTGRMRYYFRRNGKRTPLPGLPGCSEFMDAYATLLSNRPQNAEPRPAVAPKTFAALATRYFGSRQYQSLSTSSRTNYRRVIDGFLEDHGHRRVDQMTREHVDIVIGKLASKPGAGIILLKRIRTLIRYAMALGWTDRDPTSGVKGYKSKEIHTWNEAEISVFERHWPEGTRERLTFALLLYTGQRGSADDLGRPCRGCYSRCAAEDCREAHHSDP